MKKITKIFLAVLLGFLLINIVSLGASAQYHVTPPAGGGSFSNGAWVQTTSGQTPGMIRARVQSAHQTRRHQGHLTISGVSTSSPILAPERLANGPWMSVSPLPTRTARQTLH